MAIKRNYFFEELTEEDPTPLSNDPNLNDYDKTDSYSQYLDYDDVAGTVDIKLGGGKDEELDGDGTPSLEQSKYTSYNYGDFYYMEEYADMDGIFFNAMQESYADDLKIMEAIADYNSVMYTLSEADVSDDAKEEVKNGNKSTILAKIKQALINFKNRVIDIVTSIINWFKSKFSKEEGIVKAADKTSDANSEAEVDAKEEKIKETVDQANKTAVEATEDVLALLANFKPDKSTGAKFDRLTSTAKEETLKKLFDELKRLGVESCDFTQFKTYAKDGAAKIYAAYEGKVNNESFYDDADFYFFNEADEGKKKKKKIKEIIKEWWENRKQLKGLSKLESRVKQAVDRAQKNLDSMDPNSEDYSKFSKALATIKSKALGYIQVAISGIRSASDWLLQHIKKFTGKIFKDKNKNEATDKVSEAAIGEMIYAHYAMQEADVTFGDGVDVTDVMNEYIDDNTIVKEKIVESAGASYVVRLSATKLSDF